MSKKIFMLYASFFTFLLLFCAYGQQNDPHSQKIINEMTAKFKTYPSLSVSFSATITQQQDRSETEQTGKLWLKNNQYKLELLPDVVMYCDGTKIYQYMPEVKEVNVAKIDPNESDEDFQLMNPQSYFYLFSSKNFKSEWVKESTLNNRKVDIINLFPIHLKTTSFSRIQVMIEKSTLQLVYLKAFMKNGIHYALTFTPYEIRQTALPDSFFAFNKSEHPDVEVIDLSF